MSTLQNKVAVITGGNSGIGFATAKELAGQGARVIITGRNEAAVEEAAGALGVEGLVSNQGDLAAIEALVARLRTQADGVDILFINAGVGFFSPIADTTEAHFDQIMDVNFKGAFFTLSRFIPLLRPGAAVTFLSSVNATSGMAGTAVYAASKAAMHSLVKVAATELAPRGIRVNAVSPGPIDTPLFGKTGLDEAALQGFATAMQHRIPLKRFGTADEVARLVGFLSGDGAGFITGAEYVIDGGVNVNPVLAN
jgi:NAD(P)-dependent dehydrogenase (short-subunit alcohol dehydrogenase family)